MSAITPATLFCWAVRDADIIIGRDAEDIDYIKFHHYHQYRFIITNTPNTSRLGHFPVTNIIAEQVLHNIITTIIIIWLVY